MIAPGVEYPSDQAQAWLDEQMQLAEPERDRFGRPVGWRLETATAVVTVEREYINPQRSSWARRRDVVTVTAKGGES